MVFSSSSCSTFGYATRRLLLGIFSRSIKLRGKAEEEDVLSDESTRPYERETGIKREERRRGKEEKREME